MWYYRIATVASGAASGKLLQYEVGGPKVSVQTAYGVEVEVGIKTVQLKLLYSLQISSIYLLLNSSFPTS